MKSPRATLQLCHISHSFCSVIIRKDHKAWWILLTWVIPAFFLPQLNESSPTREKFISTLKQRGHRTDIFRAKSPERQLVSAGPVPLYLAAPSGPRVLLSLKQTAPVPQPRSQTSSICMTCASLFVLSRLLDAADDIELCRRHSSVHTRWINHSGVLRCPV